MKKLVPTTFVIPPLIPIFPIFPNFRALCSSRTPKLYPGRFCWFDYFIQVFGDKNPEFICSNFFKELSKKYEEKRWKKDKRSFTSFFNTTLIL